jgi:beta-xylosidase
VVCLTGCPTSATPGDVFGTTTRYYLTRSLCDWNKLTSIGRETFLVKVEWKDDWPVFNDGNNITLKTTGRDLVRSASKQSLQTWKADLSKNDLELGWYQKSKLSFRIIENQSDISKTHPSSEVILLRKSRVC